MVEASHRALDLDCDSAPATIKAIQQIEGFNSFRLKSRSFFRTSTDWLRVIPDLGGFEGWHVSFKPALKCGYDPRKE
jgi:hypothetical protein